MLTGFLALQRTLLLSEEKSFLELFTSFQSKIKWRDCSLKLLEFEHLNKQNIFYSLLPFTVVEVQERKQILVNILYAWCLNRIMEEQNLPEGRNSSRKHPGHTHTKKLSLFLKQPTKLTVLHIPNLKIPSPYGSHLKATSKYGPVKSCVD